MGTSDITAERPGRRRMTQSITCGAVRPDDNPARPSRRCSSSAAAASRMGPSGSGQPSGLRTADDRGDFQRQPFRPQFREGQAFER